MITLAEYLSKYQMDLDEMTIVYIIRSLLDALFYLH